MSYECITILVHVMVWLFRYFGDQQVHVSVQADIWAVLSIAAGARLQAIICPAR